VSFHLNQCQNCLGNTKPTLPLLFQNISKAGKLLSFWLGRCIIVVKMGCMVSYLNCSGHLFWTLWLLSVLGGNLRQCLYPNLKSLGHNDKDNTISNVKHLCNSKTVPITFPQDMWITFHEDLFFPLVFSGQIWVLKGSTTSLLRWGHPYMLKWNFSWTHDFAQYKCLTCFFKVQPLDPRTLGHW